MSCAARIIIRGEQGRTIEGVEPPQDGRIPPQRSRGERDFQYARDLVRYLRNQGNWCIGVAGYPEGHKEAASQEEDLIRLKEKVDSGADYVTTQLFFDNSRYFDFVRRARRIGIAVPIVPGIMPITNFNQIQKFTSMCGVNMPPELLKKLSDVQDDGRAVSQIGIEHAVNQCRELLGAGVLGIHFYTLNKSKAVHEILRRVK